MCSGKIDTLSKRHGVPEQKNYELEFSVDIKHLKEILEEKYLMFNKIDLFKKKKTT